MPKQRNLIERMFNKLKNWRLIGELVPRLHHDRVRKTLDASCPRNLDKIAANQRNALLSTGPQSETGKARSRLNAIKHGLTAQRMLLPEESQEQYDEFRHAVFEELMPDGIIASQLADRIIAPLRRMQRIPVFEAAVLEWGARYGPRKIGCGSWLCESRVQERDSGSGAMGQPGFFDADKRLAALSNKGYA